MESRTTLGEQVEYNAMILNAVDGVADELALLADRLDDLAANIDGVFDAKGLSSNLPNRAKELAADCRGQMDVLTELAEGRGPR